MLEPELMEDFDQVKAYAEADFEIPHNQFIERIKAAFGLADFKGEALDLGCGPGDISFRFADAFPESQILAIDGSVAMINFAKSLSASVQEKRIHFMLGRLPDVILPKSVYEIIYSNSLLHHLPDPVILWSFIRKYASSGTCVAIMDLLRPDTIKDAQIMVETYACHEAKILQHDFYHSLLAAFSIEEIKQQLNDLNLNFAIEQISDRHVFISGVMH